MRVASLLLTATSLAVSPVVGWPNAAGQCLVGQASVGQPHLPASSGDTSLAGNGIEVSVDGTPADSMTPISVASGTEHTITISSTSGTPFKGYLVVLSDPAGTISDLSTALAPQDTASGQVSTYCAGPAVVGITHTSNEDKTSVSATFVLDQDAELALDVTVVLQNTLSTGGTSAYGYGGYQLVSIAAADGGGATAAPTSAPVATPVSGAPVLTTAAPVTAAPVTAAPATAAPVLSDAPSSVPTTTGGGGGGFAASEYPSMLPSAGEGEPSTSSSSSPVAANPTSPTPTADGGGGTNTTTSGAAAPTVASWVRHGSALAAGLVAVLMELAL